METKKTFKSEIHAQEIQLVKGEFTPSQASDVIMALINQKINYHKIEGLQNWERNHKYDQEPLNNRINELEEEKRIAAAFISKMREQGKNLKIKGIIEMTASE